VAARAQQSGQPLVGMLSPISAATAQRYLDVFRQGLRDLGYSEGRNLALAVRFAEGRVASLPALAAELVALKPAVIVAGSPAAAVAAHWATRSIPIVVSSTQDPTALGLAASMARPGGNVTGF
jgi:putative tryptophan/tyrosine transport system substrate-binding protein